MRFITEFESTYGGQSQKKYIEKIPYWQERGELEMGNMIGKAFGWKPHIVLSETRHTLEIEAFPMDKWESFKRNILYYTERCEYKHLILLLFEELESFGKPAGDTITNSK